MKKMIENLNYKILGFNCFIILFIISFVNFKNLNFIRYIGLAVFQIFCVLDMIKEGKIEANKKYIVIMLLLLISMMFSLFKTTNFKESIFKILIIIDFLLFCYILLPQYLKEFEVSVILKNLINDIFILLFLLFIFFHNDYIFSYDMNRVGSLVRLRCGFNHPNTLAIFTFIGLLIGIYFVCIEKKRWKYIVYILFLGMILIKSGARTPLYVLIIFIILYLKDIVIKNNKLKFLICSFTIAMVIFYILCNGYNIRNINFDTINTILSYRLTYIKNAIEKMNENNAIFVGMGAFRNSMTFATNSIMLDNGYFNYIYQYGIISFGILLVILWNNFKIIKTSNEVNINKIFVRNMYVSFLIYSFFENILFNISSLLAILVYTFINVMNIKEKR